MPSNPSFAETTAFCAAVRFQNDGESRDELFGTTSSLRVEIHMGGMIMKAKSTITLLFVFASTLFWVTAGNAQLTVLNSNVPAGFGQAGYIQTATLDSKTGGGTLIMNGITMVVPANSVLQAPANTLQ